MAGGLDAPSVRAIVADVDALIDASPARPGIHREALALGAARVHERFEAGAPASELLAGRTAVVDRVLQRLWAREGDAFASLALLAVGGYGRGELHPRSDVDIAVLLPRDGDAAVDERLCAWITGLWDLGIEVGHSVRTIDDCEREAAADITVITNLMEARQLAGDPALLAAMRQVLDTDRMWPPREFLAAKLAEQDERRDRFHTNAYRLEPNVKESLGGLRDFQTLAWVCQRQFGRPGLEPLVEAGLLEPEELTIIRHGLEHLWKVRYLLHHLAGRREDRLLFDYQRDVARALGHAGHAGRIGGEAADGIEPDAREGDPDDGNRLIEAMMQRYYRTVMGQQRLAEIVLQGLGGIIADVNASMPATPIGNRYQLRNGFLEVVHEHTFVHYPAALLEIFVVFGRTPDVKGLRAHTVRLMRKHLPLINPRFRSDPKVKAMFLEIFSRPRKLTRTIRMMNRYGVLAAYLPAFDAIVGRMQYDLFHVYTVDEHTINVVRNLRRFTLPAGAEELPECSEIAMRLERPATLFLTGLFHDIAKGRGGDHSVLGAEDARAFATSHGLDAHDTDLMVWSVRHHLSMSMTAQGKDIDDPAVQLEFARSVGTLERLHHLYLLTVADIRATNPELWNSFKRSLLGSLHRHARLILERGLDDPLGEGAVLAGRQARTLDVLPSAAADDPRRESLWASLGESYFRQYQADEIARHTELLLAGGSTPGPLVNVHDSPTRGATEILIYTPDDEALFALIATVLETLGLDVLSATIGTTAGGHALDTFQVLEEGGTVRDAARAAEIRHALREALSAPKDIPALTTRRPSRQLKHFTVSTRVEFGRVSAAHGTGGDGSRDGTDTELRITAADRHGILSAIGRVLLAERIAVHAARIATLGERVDDVFFIGMPDGGPVDDPDVRERLAAALVERL